MNSRDLAELVSQHTERKYLLRLFMHRWHMRQVDLKVN
jgi:hypothetical protein